MKEFIKLMLMHNISKKTAESILFTTIKRILLWNQVEALDTINVEVVETVVNGELVHQEVLVTFRIFNPSLKDYQTIIRHYITAGKTNYIKLED